MLVDYLSTREPGQPEEKPKLAASIDWAAETSIASCIEGLSDFTGRVLESTTNTGDDQGLTVLLTGATGFLGREMLKQLANSPHIGRIHCVAIRANHDNEAQGGKPEQRLSIASPKIVAHTGDLTSANLGLTADEFVKLASTVDVIIHNGAMVSFMQTYQSLRGPNVSSTKELMRMALPRQIPLHYLSTAGIARLVPGADSITEKTSLVAFPPPTDGSDGYVAGKWASEQILRKATRKYRLPVHIHRPVSIIGEGAASTDLMGNLMASTRQLKVAPRLDQWAGFFDLVQVQDVAAEIVDAALSSVLTASLVSSPSISHLYRVYHESGGLCVPVQKLADFVSRELGGLSVAEVPLLQWIEMAEAAGMPYTLVSYLKSVDGVSLRVPRLLKERQRVVLPQ
jgi:thioester reductase-like protein